MIKYSAALVLASTLTICTQAANADQYFEYGVAMLKQHKYKAADKYFDQRLKLVPKDEKAHYYKALSAHYSGDKTKARELYKYVIDNFPGTPMATNAANSIKKMDEVEEKARIAAEEAAKKAAADEAAKNPGAPIKPPVKTPEPAKPAAAKPPESKPAAAAAATPTHSFHGEAKVHFDKIDNDTVISASINGRQTPCAIDASMERNFIPKSMFPHFGIKGPGEHKVKVQVGAITKTMPVFEAGEGDPRPRLGQPFLEDLEYEIDTAGSFLTFRGAVERAASSDLYTVPFRRQGKDMIVDIERLGKKAPMKISTTSDEIRFSKTNFDQLDLAIPIVVHKHGENYGFVLDELRLGRIVLKEPYVFANLPEDGGPGASVEGTIGIRFFSDWRYTVDGKNNCIRFYH